MFNCCNWKYWRQSITIVDCCLRLSFCYTGATLLLISSLIFTYQSFSDSIDCSPTITTYNSTDLSTLLISSTHLNSFCKWNSDLIPQKSNETDNRINVIPQYHWLPLLLTIFAIIIQLPYLLWKCFNKKMFQYASNKKLGHESLIQFTIVNCRSQQKIFASSFILLKLINFLLIVLFDVIINELLDNLYWLYPLHLWQHLNTTDFKSNIDLQFPKNAFCFYEVFDSALNKKETIVTLCVLSINLLLMKTFLFLWIWFFILLSILILDLIWNLFLICSFSLRMWMLIYQTNCCWTEATYKLCSKNFYSWIYTTNVWINNSTEWKQIEPKDDDNMLRITDVDNRSSNLVEQMDAFL